MCDCVVCEGYGQATYCLPLEEESFGNISLKISKQVLLLVYDNVKKCGESNKTSARVISSDYVKLPSS